MGMFRQFHRVYPLFPIQVAFDETRILQFADKMRAGKSLPCSDSSFGLMRLPKACHSPLPMRLSRKTSCVPLSITACGVTRCRPIGETLVSLIHSVRGLPAMVMYDIGEGFTGQGIKRAWRVPDSAAPTVVIGKEADMLAVGGSDG